MTANIHIYSKINANTGIYFSNNDYEKQAINNKRLRITNVNKQYSVAKIRKKKSVAIKEH